MPVVRRRKAELGCFTVWCQPVGTRVSSGLPVTRGTSHNVLAGGWVSEGTAEVPVAWRKRETRQHKSVGKQAALFLLLV